MGTNGHSGLSRRDFLALCRAGICLLAGTSLCALPSSAHARGARKGLIREKLSPWFTTLEGDAIRCTLCPRECRVADGERGHCRARENRRGKYYSLVYGNPCAVHLDPIEKKPFFHFHPSSWSFSIATAGCNLECKFCQNWEISQASPEEVFSRDFSPERTVKEALRSGAKSIAYTYVEPTIFYEYMLDTARLARKAGLLNVCHTNAFINPEPLRELCTVIDAANCDLKGFTEEYYRDMCGGKLAPVLESLKTLKRLGVHVEITNLVIPSQNDDIPLAAAMCRWIAGELGAETPVHFSRFYPLYKLRSLPPTPVATLEKIRDAALDEGLKYVYIGNLPGHEGQHTYCPKCGRVVVRRTGFMVTAMEIDEGKCGQCGELIAGTWS